ncbi:MAG: hypothetical protein ACRDYB_04105 [Acidimicrobiales bacterium]
MSIERMSVSLPEGVAGEVRRRAGRGGVSAWLARAAVHEIERGDLAEYLAELEVELGAPDPAVLAEAHAAFEQANVQRRGDQAG